MEKYKKIVSMTGEYNYRNYTVKDIIDIKGTRTLSQTLPFSPKEAEAAQEAGIDLINTRFDYFNPELSTKIRKAASYTFMSFVIPLLSTPTKEDALRHSFKAMELGADAVLVNTAIAQSANPGLMGEAFKLGVEAGRKAYLAGRIPQSKYANPSSPTSNPVNS